MVDEDEDEDEDGERAGVDSDTTDDRDPSAASSGRLLRRGDGEALLVLVLVLLLGLLVLVVLVERVLGGILRGGVRGVGVGVGVRWERSERGRGATVTRMRHPKTSAHETPNAAQNPSWKPQKPLANPNQWDDRRHPKPPACLVPTHARTHVLLPPPTTTTTVHYDPLPPPPPPPVALLPSSSFDHPLIQSPATPSHTNTPPTHETDLPVGRAFPVARGLGAAEVSDSGWSYVTPSDGWPNDG